LGRCRRRLFLGGALERLRGFALLEVCHRGRDQAHGVGGRQPLVPARRPKQECPGQPVHDKRAGQGHSYRGWGPASSHRSIVSGSATSPTSCTPAARMTASTCTTRAYATRPSARKYTPVGRFVRTKAGKVDWKSS